MNFFRVVLCAAAGLAGWWSVAWWNGNYSGTNTARAGRLRPLAPPSPVPATSAETTLQDIIRPRAGSAELSRINALVASAPNENIAAVSEHVKTWPPGAARTFVLGLLKARMPLADEPSGPDGDAGDPPYNRFRELEKSMAAGRIERDGVVAGVFVREGFDALSRWVSTDPAVATAAILKMPPGGNRSGAVDSAAEVLARTDPAAALEFVLKSGEQHLGRATAQAWAESVIRNALSNETPGAGQPYLERMTVMQQDTLFAALARTASDGSYFDDSNANSKDPLHVSDLEVLARTVLLQAKESGPGIESFVRKIADYPYVADGVRKKLESQTALSPAQQTALEILYASMAENAATHGADPGEFIPGANAENPSIKADPDAVLTRAAPSLLPALARSGHLTEALQQLDRIADPDARRASLEAVLPYWMDADPAAARAAIDAAPLTALERERWQRHPAFLLHP